MLSIIKENLLRKDLTSRSKPVLCAISGGIDSMVMLDCLIKLNINVAVAHIDHLTRDGQSTKDLKFVENFCLEHNIVFHCTELKPESISNGNFQEEARKFRYNFLTKILHDYNYSCIATAHHLNDDFETFIINLTRGTGIKGLTGIPFSNEKVIRPLHGLFKSEINLYAQKNNVSYVEDSSNKEDIYLRNKIRHHVIPSIANLHDKALYGFKSSIEILNTTKDLLQNLVIEKYVSRSKFGNLIVFKKDLPLTSEGVTILHFAFGEYGFNSVQLKDILTSSFGRKIANNEWEIYNDRQQFTLLKKNNYLVEIEVSEEGEYTLNDGRKLTIQKTEKPGIPFDKNPFPFKIRSKLDGDRFKPAGMKGKSKSVKNFITDLKLSKEEKQRILILEKDAIIHSILGYRNAHFNTTPKSYITVDIQ